MLLSLRTTHHTKPASPACRPSAGVRPAGRTGSQGCQPAHPGRVRAWNGSLGAPNKKIAEKIQVWRATLFPLRFDTFALHFCYFSLKISKRQQNNRIIIIANLGGPGWPPFRQGSEDAAWKGHSGLAQAWNGCLGAPNKEIAKKSKFGG